MDRNIALLTALRALSMSLSARRAWIEIDEILRPLFDKYWSLSARRAWIEIELSTDEALEVVVALRKESVDRNMGAS